MKVGYITKEDPNDIRAYSGTHYSMYQALQSNFGQVIPLGPLDHIYKYVAKIKGRGLRALSGKTYKFQYNERLARKYAILLEEKIRKEKPQALIGSLVSPEVAFLETEVPIYLTTDATFPLLKDLYQSHSNLHPNSIKSALKLERMAFQKAEKLILPLQWLADSAMKQYEIPASRIEIIPYGPNLEIPSEKEINDLIETRIEASQLKLLFVGVRWKEKGGPKAVEVFEELRKLGIDTELKVIGCKPDLASKMEGIELLGFLDKSISSEANQLNQAYEQAHFFILPTNAECVGMSFLEAAAFGLPSIGSTVGGVPEAVLHKKTGYNFEPETDSKVIAELIKRAWDNKSHYQSQSELAYKQVRNRMNWDSWGMRVREVVYKLT